MIRTTRLEIFLLGSTSDSFTMIHIIIESTPLNQSIARAKNQFILHRRQNRPYQAGDLTHLVIHHL
jgi:hypothetical protein